MNHFWMEHGGEVIRVIFSLMGNGKLLYSPSSGNEMGVSFEYPIDGDLEDTETIYLGIMQLDDMDEDVRSMIYQKLQLNSEVFSLAYT